MLVHLDLFAGIGGFSLACHWNGIETIGFVEIDKYCQKVLKKHWPGVPIVEDIRDVEGIKRIVANSQKLHEYASHNQRGEGEAQVPQSGNSSGKGDIRRPIAEIWQEAAISEVIKEITADTTRGRLQQCECQGESSHDSSQVGEVGRWRGNNGSDPAILVTAGFPCQPFSVAGRQLSQGDNRYLWPQTLAVIEALKPKWVLLENVAGIINLALDTVLSDLECQGYSREALVIPACAVNAPHRRDRVWVLANSGQHDWPNMEIAGDHGQTGSHHPEGEGRSIEPPRPSCCERGDQDVADDSGDPPRTSWQKLQQGGMPTNGSVRIAVANPTGNRGTSGLSGSQQRHEGQPREPINSSDEGTVTYSQRNGVQGRGSVGYEASRRDWWAVEPQLGRVAHGVPHRVDRLKCLGNAIVPQVAYEIIKAIVEIENG